MGVGGGGEERMQPGIKRKGRGVCTATHRALCQARPVRRTLGIQSGKHVGESFSERHALSASTVE
ncbi:hypothetical protein JZ751_009721, partial [Albula glossodonta]